MKQRNECIISKNLVIKNNNNIINIKKTKDSKKNKEININFVKCLCLFLLVLFILSNKAYINNFNDLIKNERIKRNNEIIDEEKYYKNFENIKKRYISNPILKPYLNEIKIISHIFHKNETSLKIKKTNVHICIGLNNKYLYPYLVSIESILVNCNKEQTFITFHILCSPDLTENDIFKLKSLIYQFPLNLEFIFYDMGNNFITLKNKRFSQAALFRLLSPIIFDIDRIIYLDGDTLVFKDLNEMYKIKFNDNYILGILDFFIDGIDNLGIKSEKFINSGVILINLEKIRNDNKILDIINVMDNEMKLTNDQIIINYVFYPKIGIISSKYVTFNFFNNSEIDYYLNLIRTKINYTELYEDVNDPTIIHFVIGWPKIWNIKSKYNKAFIKCEQKENYTCKNYHNIWYYYANQTEYYKEILKYYRKKF